ncbi:hypothetical protein KC930_00185 [Candidatus Saccharibacteria bacterium]|nr:hypothetical protein [Candidatus Saccharibacteria bacterium]
MPKLFTPELVVPNFENLGGAQSQVLGDPDCDRLQFVLVAGMWRLSQLATTIHAEISGISKNSSSLRTSRIKLDKISSSNGLAKAFAPKDDKSAPVATTFTGDALWWMCNNYEIGRTPNPETSVAQALMARYLLHGELPDPEGIQFTQTYFEGLESAVAEIIDQHHNRKLGWSLPEAAIKRTAIVQSLFGRKVLDLLPKEDVCTESSVPEVTEPVEMTTSDKVNVLFTDSNGGLELRIWDF